MAISSITGWLRDNRDGDVGDFMKALSLTLDEANARVLVLEEEGLIEHYAYRWDGTPVYRLVMEREHNQKTVMERRETLDLLTGNYAPGDGDYDEDE